MAIRKSYLTVIPTAVIGLWTARANAAESGVCQKTLNQTAETTIVFEPPATFTICRDGHDEDDVVTGRPIYVEVAADEHTMFRFSVHGLSSQPQRTGLTHLARRSHTMAQNLHQLADSVETVTETPVRSPPASQESPQRSVDRVVETTRFHDTLAAIERESFDLGEAAATLATWCGEVTRNPILPAALDQAVRDKCARVRAEDVRKRTSTFLETIGAFRAAREEAWGALIATGTQPPDDHGAEGNPKTAGSAVERTRELAIALRRQARELAPVAEQIAETSGLVHEAVRGAGSALRIGVPFLIGKLEHSGFAVLQIDESPVVLSRAAEDWEETEQETISRRFRFAVVSPHYVDIEAGIGLVAGVPGVPATTTRGGTTVLASKSVSQFVGLALVELEPIRFFHPDKPLAGVLRFPVIGIPLNRDPTQNYFVGAGLGWTGIGSITAGPFITREASFAQGYADGQTLPSGVSLANVTSPAYQVGYFASASIDLLGLVHLFIPVHEPTFDIITGADVVSYPSH